MMLLEKSVNKEIKKNYLIFLFNIINLWKKLNYYKIIEAQKLVISKRHLNKMINKLLK